MTGADVIMSTAPVYWIMKFVFLRMHIAALCILKRIKGTSKNSQRY